MDTRDRREDSHSPQFATTQWSLVIAAGQESSPNSRQALATLCETYWYPLYAYARRRTLDVDQAQDLTQAFFGELLEKNYVGTATPKRGRFRAFLLTAFKHFLSKQWDKARAQKRGGGRAPISLDFQAADSSFRIEPASGLTAEQFYDQQWAITLLDRVMQRLESDFRQAGKSKQFQELKKFIVAGRADATYSQVAARLGMTEAAVKKAVSRLRQQYRRRLRDEIAQTVEEPEEIDEEIRSLFAIFAS